MKTNTKEITLFIIITFGWTWALNLPRVLESNNLIYLPPILSQILGNLAILGPGIAAFWLTWKNEGASAVKQLWRKGGKGTYAKKWIFPAIFLMPIIGLLTIFGLKIF